MQMEVKVEGILSQAIAAGAPALSEFDAKRIFTIAGIPTIEEYLVPDAAAAASRAASLGYPVVLKACGRNILHKSERGLVCTGLRDEAAVFAAADGILQALGGEAIDGFLLQRQARGRREFVAGGLRDAIFGPCVMFGIGGITIEAMSNVAFRLAPVSEHDALEMMEEVQGAKLLEAFRGEPEVDKASLARIIQAVGKLLDRYPEIEQIDVNPLLIEDGKPVAVDALVSLRTGKHPASSTRNPALAASESPAVSTSLDLPVVPEEYCPIPESAFKALFEPESLAIVGATGTPTKWGFRIPYNTIEGRYTGRLYGVNPNHSSVLEFPCFPSIAELPEPVDLALIVVPPPAVLDSVRACIARGVKAIVVITAGFGEVGDARMAEAERELARIGHESGVLIVGPNCAGLVSPAPNRVYSGMISRYPDAGGLTVISQSGNVGGTALSWASLHQVGVARFVSTGNEAATRTEDFLAFSGRDEQTSAVLSYIEGTRDGRRLYDSLRRVSQSKPVVVVKGGRTQAGTRAAQSHTGALASEARLFRAMCRQAGAHYVNDIYEAMEVAAVMGRTPLPKGRRVGIVSQGGGWGVIAADACAEAGLDVVPLPDEVMAELDTFLPHWWSRNNPVDLVASTDITALSRTVETVIKHPDIDAVILLGVGYIASARARYVHSDLAIRHGLDKLTELGSGIELQDIQRIAAFSQKYQKPLLVASDTVLLAYGAVPNTVVQELESLGTYVFSSPAHVARALAHLVTRYEFTAGKVRKA